VSNCLLSHGYQAIDTHRRDPERKGRVFELRAPSGEVLKTYSGIMLDQFIEEMEREIERRES
jgi:hypothetical protein